MDDLMQAVEKDQVHLTSVSHLDAAPSDHNIAGEDPPLSLSAGVVGSGLDVGHDASSLGHDASSLLVGASGVGKEDEDETPAAVISLMLPGTSQTVGMVDTDLNMEPTQDPAGSSSVLCEGVLPTQDHHLVLEHGHSLQEVEFVDNPTTFQVKDTESGTAIVEGQAIQFDDGSTAYIHQVSADKFQSFEEGQAVQLDDGSTAYIIRAPLKDNNAGGIQAVHLEDGTTALIQGTVTTFGGADDETASLSDLDHFASPTVAVNIEMTGKMFRCLQRGCEKTFSSAHHLKVHIRSHTGEKPFACEYQSCGKAFATSYGLKSHTRVHTGEKPYKCTKPPCMKAFKTSGDLQKHIRTHTGEKPFKCPFEGCNKAFTTANIRKVHIRTHTGEKPYVCKEAGCTRAFASATNYKNHMRIHSGEKPYVCTVAGCGRRFTEYSSLYKHHVVHTHHKPYACTLCGKHYRQTSTLAMHKRTAHGIMDVCDSDLHVTVGTSTDGLELEGQNLHLSAIKNTDRLTTGVMTTGVGTSVVGTSVIGTPVMGSVPVSSLQQTMFMNPSIVSSAASSTTVTTGPRTVTMVASLDPETGLATIEPSMEPMDGPEFHVVATPSLGDQENLQHVLVTTPITLHQGLHLKIPTNSNAVSSNEPIPSQLITAVSASEPITTQFITAVAATEPITTQFITHTSKADGQDSIPVDIMTQSTKAEETMA